MRPLQSVALLLATCATLSLQAQQNTAAQIWLQIQHRYAPSPPADTVDTLKAGDPTTPVTGVATTFLDTMAVLREAVRRGDNLVITHEPTFYNHRDETAQFQQDPVYKEKLAYIQQHHLVVYRLHDEIHADNAGDNILLGLYKVLGWQNYPHPANLGKAAQYLVTIPPTTLAGLVRTLQARLQPGALRVEGDPTMPITRVAVVPGAAGLAEQVLALNTAGVQVLIAGEASEWETVEYARDAIAQGRHKALILLGHQVSEEPGMEECAQQLRVLFPNLRVDHIPAEQPFWKSTVDPADAPPLTH